MDAEHLRAVLDGRRPSDGQSLLWARREDRLPGFNLTFSAPKGVSLLFALADARTSLLVREAHDRAVAAALGYLEREAGEVRRGRDGVDRLLGAGSSRRRSGTGPRGPVIRSCTPTSWSPT